MMKTFRILSGILIALNVYAQSPKDDLILWYSHPAKEWNEALPVGNGSLGGMVFGGVEDERIQLNEKSLWAGGKEEFANPRAGESLKPIRELLFQSKYAEAQKLAQETLMGNKKQMSAYQTLGDLHLNFGHSFADAQNYRRELDMRNGLASISYSIKDVRYTRTVFSSAPDKVMVIQLTASKPGMLSFKVEMTRPGKKAEISYEGNSIRFYEHVNEGNGVRVAAHIRAVARDGAVTVSPDSLMVKGATTCTLIVSAATDYFGEDPVVKADALIAAALKKDANQLQEIHSRDFRQFFDRVDFNLGTTDAVYFPTDQRLAAIRKGNDDPHLLILYYQFGRYLLISSSRPGTLPANLQGLWADGLNPPWDADYHININIQMNYWPAEVANLSELHAPFFVFIDSLRRDGRKTAKEMYGANGVVAHFTTDAWHFTEPYGQTQWAMWPMGYAWCATHLWEHFLFKPDMKFLKSTAYPLMKDGAVFCLDWLVENPQTKELVSGPSISPENTFRTADGEIATMVMGPTMDHMIIRHLFESTLKAATLLQTDLSLQKRLEKALKKIAPTRLTTDGRIMEWTEEFDEPEPGHRHISHLYGLFPGNEINARSSPELLEAARKTIEYRLGHGGGHTGWSRAWIINFYARLHDGDKALFNFEELLKKSTLPNLFDNHPPFQIDGNFGAVSGVTEMLLQSHAGEIEILPALPLKWDEGRIAGLRARGAFEVSIEWGNNELRSLTIKSIQGNPCTIRYRGKTFSFKTTAGTVYDLNPDLQFVTK